MNTEETTGTQITSRIRAHLASLPRGECMFCGGAKWQPVAWARITFYVSPHLDAPVGGSKPCLALVCEGCGFVALMDAFKAGVLVAGPPQEEPVPDQRA